MPKPLYVKFRRPFFDSNGQLFGPGVVELPANYDKKLLPSTAKVLKDEEEAKEAVAESDREVAPGQKALAVDKGNTLTEIGKSL